jgi:dihydroorotate dehydrogenase (NAD+) catalytic subunit
MVKLNLDPFKVKIAGLDFKSPLIAASGTWAYGLEFSGSKIENAMGAFVTKSLSLMPSAGNPMPRIYETDAGMLNSIGLQNMGIEEFLNKVEPHLLKNSSPYILSIYANRIEDFEALADRAQSSSALAIELNISCPNIEKGGLEFSSDAQVVEKLVKSLRRRIKKALWVKLSPNVTSIEEMARAAEAAGADALCLINTVVGMSIDVDAKRPSLAKRRGGLSGPAIRPIAIDKVYRCFKVVGVPIVGIGGIRNARDVMEFVLAGAQAVQIGTWNFRNPFVYEEILKDLEIYLAKHSAQRLGDLVGQAHFGT